MNVLIYAINEIKNNIPYEILYTGFTIDEQPTTINMSSLDNKIISKLLKPKVLMDANLVGGIETLIPLYNISPSYSENFYTVYNIPPELTMNKEIISALNLANLPGQGFFNNNALGYVNTNAGSINAVNNIANRIGNSFSDIGIISNAHLELVAYNTVLVYANYRSIMNYGIRVILENDNNLSNISPRSYINFAMLCVLACKAYIYNKLIIKINSGFLQSGQELGMFKTILDSYESAEADYRTFLKEVWTATAFINDNTRYNRFLRSMIAPDI